MRAPGRYLVGVVLATGLLVPIGVALAATTVVTRNISAKGGTLTFSATVKNAATCAWTSSPTIAGFNETVPCTVGTNSRSAKFPANKSTSAVTWAIKLSVAAKAATVHQWNVVEAAHVVPTTTTTSTTSTTTTTTTSTTTTSTTTTIASGPRPGLTSPNWAGYQLWGEPGGYQSVSSYWTVPTLNCSIVTNGQSSALVGINGALGNPAIFEAGTESDCVSGVQQNYAWWTDESQTGSQHLFSVAAGDSIYGQVAQLSTGDWQYEVDDVTAGRSMFNTEPFTSAAVSAEWIVQDPMVSGTSQLAPLANFGTVTFHDLGLTVPGGTWSVPPYSNAVEMLAPDNSVLAYPSETSGFGAALTFSIAYH